MAPMRVADTLKLARSDRRAGSSSDMDVIQRSSTSPAHSTSALPGIRIELSSHPSSTSVFLITPFLILKKSDNMFLLLLNHPTPCTLYIMPKLCKNNKSARRQLRRFLKHARIYIDYISTRTVFATNEPRGTSGDPGPLADPLHGPNCKGWPRYSFIIIIWDHLELVNGLVGLDTISDITQCTHNGHEAPSLGPSKFSYRYPKPPFPNGSVLELARKHYMLKRCGISSSSWTGKVVVIIPEPCALLRSRFLLLSHPSGATIFSTVSICRC